MRRPKLSASMARPAIRAGGMEVEPLACANGGVALDEWNVASEAVVQDPSGERPGLGRDLPG